MAYERRIEEISEFTGVDFYSDLYGLRDSLQQAIYIYNYYADAPEIKGKKISLKQTKTDRKTYKYLLELIPPILERGSTDGQEA